VGILMHLLLFGKVPFEGDIDFDLRKLIKNNQINYNSSHMKKVSKEARNFLKSLLTTEVENRPTAKEALNDKWLKKATASKFSLGRMPLKSIKT